jgi:hypothetical protein
MPHTQKIETPHSLDVRHLQGPSKPFGADRGYFSWFWDFSNYTKRFYLVRSACTFAEEVKELVVHPLGADTSDRRLLDVSRTRNYADSLF